MLHIDGARLSNAAAHLRCPIREIAAFADVISFGGTKNGLMGAEAIVFMNESARTNFKFQRKQAMQLSSKTRFLAAQFYAYLKDDLYLEIAAHVHTQAKRLQERLRHFPELEVAFPVHSNAVFVRAPKAWLKPLREKTFFYVWDSSTNLCRWMLSWDWSDERTDQWIQALEEVRTCSQTK